MAVFVSESNLNFSPSPWVGCVCVCVCETQSCPTLCDLMDCSLLGFSVCGILQTRIPGWAAIPFSSGSWSRDRTQVSCTADRFFTIWTTSQALPYLGTRPIHIYKKRWDFNLKLYLILSQEKNHSSQESCKKKKKLKLIGNRMMVDRPGAGGNVEVMVKGCNLSVIRWIHSGDLRGCMAPIFNNDVLDTWNLIRD